MRNPKWHRDEIILALDLYYNPNRGPIDKGNPNVIQLSEILNKLPLFPNKPDVEKFRNPNGVCLKLSNFLAIDPSYEGKGMKRFSNLDKELFYKYSKNIENLQAIASEIKKAVLNDEIRNKVYQIEDDEESIKDSVMEGQVLYKLHKVRERSKEIVLLKKKEALSMVGHLACEVCVFDFNKFYGDLGKGYIECHHRIPLAKLKVETKIRLEDLALVCANCHRMLHRSIDTLSVEELKTKAKYEFI